MVKIFKYISIIQRNTNRYLDMVLEEEQIGCGQQLFLTYIYENPGITMYDLAKLGVFDKGTVTKAVQKMERQGYVKILTDEYDKRIRHLYVTEQAEKTVQKIYEVRKHWKEALAADLSLQEEKELLKLLTRMAQYSCEEISNTIEKKENNKYGDDRKESSGI